jgi:two-component sensor histidine kinase
VSSLQSQTDGPSSLETPLILDREADHRIANNLALIVSLLRLRARNVSQQAAMAPADVKMLLEDIAARVEMVARLHRMLSQSYRDAQVDLCAYVRELCGSLTGALSAKGQAHITCHTANPNLLPPDQVLTIGLLISELVTNAVKYAHPSGLSVRIDVDCRQTEGRLVLHIADDGVGLPEGFDPEKDAGLGLRMVRSFARQLGGTLHFESPGTGTCVRLEMPLPGDDPA